MVKMLSVPEIIPIWQPLGKSTYRITVDIAKKLGKKTAHTGVLDPLAEGVIIILAGPERLNKIDYAGWKKTYEFEVVFGLATDSYDGMGLITATDFEHKVNDQKLKEALQKLKGPYIQHVPLYSATRLKGKRLFEYPKRGMDLIGELPTKSGEIYSIELTDLYKEELGRIVSTILSKIAEVKHGEFRQEETSEGWQSFLANLNNKNGNKSTQKLCVAKIKAEISRGLYVRSLSQDIARALDTVGMVYSLVRTRNGVYTKDLCINLNEFYDKLF